MKKALLDASSAILLHKTGLYGRLVRAYRIVMVESVFIELTQNSYSGSEVVLRAREKNEILVMASQPDVKDCLTDENTMDRGERDTIAHYLAGKGDFVVTDDRKAARYCRNNGVPFINALLFPRILLLTGELEPAAYEVHFQRLVALGRYSEEIMAFARASTSADLHFFFP